MEKRQQINEEKVLRKVGSVGLGDSQACGGETCNGVRVERVSQQGQWKGMHYWADFQASRASKGSPQAVLVSGSSSDSLTNTKYLISPSSPRTTTFLLVLASRLSVEKALKALKAKVDPCCLPHISRA
jgi:hypothetical protein